MRMLDFEVKINRVAELIMDASRIVVFTGAGASTESGIPDFRSPGGIWSKFDPEDFTIQKFISSPVARMKQWRFLIESGLITEAEPNRAHQAVAELEKMGRLRCVITQNVDNLHQKAGNSPEKIYELHGTMGWARCLGCGGRFELGPVIERLKESDYSPCCESCGGIIKPDVILFGETLPQKVLEDAINHSRNCDLFIVIGSSLVVYPAAYMPSYAAESGAKLVIINMSPTPFDDIAEIVINGPAGEVMGGIMKSLRQRN